MSDILCVTNRKLCRGSFLERVGQIARAKPAGLILREKDLPEDEYIALARQVLKICGAYGVNCFLHTFAEAAAALGAEFLHVPFPILMSMSGREKARFRKLGASCHSVEEAKAAEKQGCTYITAGHIFETDCKRGLAGRGLKFLEEICACVSIPVYAIGGIDAENIGKIRKAGAAGACVMSGLMECKDTADYLRALERRNDFS
mgnify:CR=1 FL=1